MTPPAQDAADPKGLIREAFRIDGITYGECRSIFMDWALSLPPGRDPADDIAALLARHAAPDHPMTAVLREGLVRPARPRRRGGWRGRRADASAEPQAGAPAEPHTPNPTSPDGDTP